MEELDSIKEELEEIERTLRKMNKNLKALNEHDEQNWDAASMALIGVNEINSHRQDMEKVVEVAIDPSNDEDKTKYGDLLEEYNYPIYFQTKNNKSRKTITITSDYERVIIPAKEEGKEEGFQITVWMHKDDKNTFFPTATDTGSGVVKSTAKPNSKNNICDLYGKATDKTINVDKNVKTDHTKVIELVDKVEDLASKINNLIEKQTASTEELADLTGEYKKLKEQVDTLQKQQEESRKEVKGLVKKVVIGGVVTLALVVGLIAGHFAYQSVHAKDNVNTQSTQDPTPVEPVDPTPVEPVEPQELKSQISLGEGYTISKNGCGVVIYNETETYYGYKVKNGAEEGTIFVNMKNGGTKKGNFSGSLKELVISKDGNGSYSFNERNMTYTVPDEVELSEIVDDYAYQLNKINAGKKSGTSIIDGTTNLNVDKDNSKIEFAENVITDFDWGSSNSADMEK